MCSLLLISAFILSPGSEVLQKAEKDEDKIKDTWVLISSERSGKSEITETTLKMEVEFEAKRFRFRLPAGAKHWQTIKLDSTTKPKSIDSLGTENRQNTKPMLGIYELDGDNLKICWAKEGGERPKEFTSKAETGEWLWIFKRAKKE